LILSIRRLRSPEEIRESKKPKSRHLRKRKKRVKRCKRKQDIISNPSLYALNLHNTKKPKYANYNALYKSNERYPNANDETHNYPEDCNHHLKFNFIVGIKKRKQYKTNLKPRKKNFVAPTSKISILNLYSFIFHVQTRKL
jgi:hypothetical protein